MDAHISGGDLVGKSRLAGTLHPTLRKVPRRRGTRAFLAGSRWDAAFVDGSKPNDIKKNSVGRAGRLSVDRGDWGIAETSAVG